MTHTCLPQITSKISVDMSHVTTIILAGGNGTRLDPLTNNRCKPAVCFGGKYRLIDSLYPMPSTLVALKFSLFLNIFHLRLTSTSLTLIIRVHFLLLLLSLYQQNKDIRKNHGSREQRALFDKICITSLKLLQSIFLFCLAIRYIT